MKVVFLESCVLELGVNVQPKEVRDLPQDVAQELIRRGVAEPETSRPRGR